MTTVRLAPGHRVQFEEAQGQHVLLYPEGLVELSETASDILARLVAPVEVDALVGALAEEYDAGPDELAGDVRAFLEDAHARGWITCS